MCCEGMLARSITLPVVSSDSIDLAALFPSDVHVLHHTV